MTQLVSFVGVYTLTHISMPVISSIKFLLLFLIRLGTRIKIFSCARVSLSFGSYTLLVCTFYVHAFLQLSLEVGNKLGKMLVLYVVGESNV